MLRLLKRLIPGSRLNTLGVLYLLAAIGVAKADFGIDDMILPPGYITVHSILLTVS